MTEKKLYSSANQHGSSCATSDDIWYTHMQTRAFQNRQVQSRFKIVETWTMTSHHIHVRTCTTGLSKLWPPFWTIHRVNCTQLTLCYTAISRRERSGVGGFCMGLTCRLGARRRRPQAAAHPFQPALAGSSAGQRPAPCALHPHWLRPPQGGCSPPHWGSHLTPACQSHTPATQGLQE